MACMYHVCFKCRRDWMDNSTWKACPYCKGHDIMSYLDEVTAAIEENTYWEDED